MDQPAAIVSDLTTRIIDEILAAFNLRKESRLSRLLAPCFWLPARRFARIAEQVDADVRRYGLPEAARRLLPAFVDGLQAHGVERIPTSGPLLVASNHPGAVQFGRHPGLFAAQRR